MSRENVELIERMLDRARNDPSTLEAVLHDDAQFDVAGVNPEGGTAFRGPAAAVHQVFWQVWKLRDGKAERVTHHSNRAEALESAGLSE